MYACLKALAALCFNIGWLFPVYLCISSIIDWCRLEASPVIYGTEGLVNGFPFLQFAEEMLNVTCVWLGIVIAFHTLMRARIRTQQTQRP